MAYVEVIVLYIERMVDVMKMVLWWCHIPSSSIKIPDFDVNSQRLTKFIELQWLTTNSIVSSTKLTKTSL